MPFQKVYNNYEELDPGARRRRRFENNLLFVAVNDEDSCRDKYFAY